MTNPETQPHEHLNAAPESPESAPADMPVETDAADEATEDEDDAGEDAATPLAAAQARIAELEALLAETKDKALRALAEAENTRRRTERDRQDTAKFAVASFARDLLSVSDNLGRALEAIKPEQRQASPELENIFVGVDATARELMRVLAGNGIKKIEAMGQKFDPNQHEVLFEVDMPGAAPGTIVQVIEPGYMIHERLLRPARVGVAKSDGETPHVVDKEI
jgi:molecular chaperone GrpE